MLLIMVIPLCSAPKRNLSMPTPANEDEAVVKERRRALRGNLKGDLLVLRNLTKIYGSHCSSQSRLAVNQLCLRMQKAEVCAYTLVAFYVGVYVCTGSMNCSLYLIAVLWLTWSKWSRKNNYLSYADWGHTCV